MTAMFQNFQKGRALPVSQTAGEEAATVGGMRRRLSSLSLQIQPSMISTSAWALRRSKSVSSIGESASTSIRNWWEWGWAWFLSRKPTFAQDLEMNEQERSILGCHNKGRWRHVVYKVRSGIRKLVGSDEVGLPQTVRYNSYNFDDGNKNRA